MMEERNDCDKLDEVLLPGFRFHPTDEELVGFYLKRKIQQRPLSIELIKQLDIYKYDPWDLPKMATTGEKEWYFYCPRDRKYRNSARPNRVTGAGFWKATGTDRPIYASEGTKCIGLKKSLVFYKGKAAKGIKTDWMMHEFRLPSLTDHSMPPKRFLDKNIPANDSWAICRIFKKTNSTAHRALSHSWVSPLPETSTTTTTTSNQFMMSSTSENNMSMAPKTSSSIHYNYNNDYHHPHIQSSSNITTSSSYSPLDFASLYKPINPLMPTTSFLFSPFELTVPPPGSTKCNNNIDVSSMLLNMSSTMLGDFGGMNKTSSTSSDQCIDFGGFSTITSLPPHDHDHQMQVNNMSNDGDDHHGNDIDLMKNQNVMHHVVDDDHIGFPFSTMGHEAWKPSSLWEYSSSCPSEMSTSVSTTKCYT